MFVSDEILVPVIAPVASGQLAILTGITWLYDASQAAWHDGITGVGLGPGLPELVHVLFREPAGRGAVTVLTLRWEAVYPDGGLFPVLDADITFVPYGSDATLIGLDGVWRTRDQIAAAVIRALLTQMADAISGPRQQRPRSRAQAPALASPEGQRVYRLTTTHAPAERLGARKTAFAGLDTRPSGPVGVILPG